METWRHLLGSWLRVLFVGVLLRVKINLYGDKSNPLGRDEKMLVSPGDFQAVDQRTTLSSLPKGSF